MHHTTPYKSAVHRLSIGRMLSVAGGEVAFVALMALVFGRTHSAIWGSAALLAVVGTTAWLRRSPACSATASIAAS